MKRMLLLGAAVSALFLLQASHTAKAGDKVQICHMNSSNTEATYEYEYARVDNLYGNYSYGYTYVYSFGNVEEVSVNALGAHQDHGDSTSYGVLSDYLIDYYENWSQYNYSYTSSGGHWHYYPSVYHSWSYTYSSIRTDAEIKNADCYVYSYASN